MIELDDIQQPCFMVWTAGLEQEIVSDTPLILELKRGKDQVIVQVVINPRVVGNKISGIGIR